MQRAEKYERKAARNSTRSMVALMREELYNTLDFEKFAEELANAESVELKEFEKRDFKVYEGCMPIEVMARRGADRAEIVKLPALQPEGEVLQQLLREGLQVLRGNSQGDQPLRRRAGESLRGFLRTAPGRQAKQSGRQKAAKNGGQLPKWAHGPLPLNLMKSS